MGGLCLLVALSLSPEGLADRGRDGDNWVRGILDGELKTDVSDRSGYEGHLYHYSTIDERRMAHLNGSPELDFTLGLDVFVMSESRVRDFATASTTGGSPWADLNELMLASSNSIINDDDPDPPDIADYPDYIAIYLEEPNSPRGSIGRPTTSGPARLPRGIAC